MLRRAGDLIEAARRRDLQRWMIRETGAIAGLAGFAVGVAAQECYEAAALASRPLGEILPTNQPRLSLLRAGAGRRGRRDLAVQRAADPVHPLGRAGARARQRGRAQARPAHAGQRRLRPSPASSRRPACPRVCCTCCPAAPTAGEALVADPQRAGRLVHRLHAPPAAGSAELAGAAPQAGAPGAGRQLGAGRARRRRPRPRGLRRRLGLVPAPGPDLHDRRAGTSCTRASPTTTSAALAEHADHLPVGDPATGQVALGPLIDAGQRDKVHGLVTSTRGRRRAAGRRRHATRACSTGRPCSTTSRTDMPAYAAGGLRPGRAGRAVLHRRRGGAAGRRHRLRPVAGHPHRRRDAAAWRWPSGSRPASCTSTTRPSTTRRSPRSAACSTPAPAPASAAPANLDAFTDQRWITVRGDIPPYPF